MKASPPKNKHATQTLMTLFIRRATLTDLEPILDLFRTTVQQINAKDYSPAQVRAWVEAADKIEHWQEKIMQDYFLVAWKSETLVGFCSLQHSGYLDTLYIHPLHQREGIARALLALMEHQASQSPYEILITDASVTARPFFEKKGFRMVAEQRKILHETELTNFRMEKILPPKLNQVK
jgi:putative acetyltransferase